VVGAGVGVGVTYGASHKVKTPLTECLEVPWLLLAAHIPLWAVAALKILSFEESPVFKGLVNFILYGDTEMAYSVRVTS
jgi:hypothetical protein